MLSLSLLCLLPVLGFHYSTDLQFVMLLLLLMRRLRRGVGKAVVKPWWCKLTGRPNPDGLFALCQTLSYVPPPPLPPGKQQQCVLQVCSITLPYWTLQLITYSLPLGPFLPGLCPQVVSMCLSHFRHSCTMSFLCIATVSLPCQL